MTIKITNTDPLFSTLRARLVKYSAFFKGIVEDGDRQSFNVSGAIESPAIRDMDTQDSRIVSACFQEASNLFIRKFDIYLVGQIMAQSQRIPESKTPWPGANLVAGHEAHDKLLHDSSVRGFYFPSPNFLSDADAWFTHIQYPVRVNEKGWNVPTLSLHEDRNGTGKYSRIHPAYVAAKHEVRLWLRPGAISGHTDLTKFVEMEWTGTRFVFQYQLGYRVDPTLCAHDRMERQRPASDLTNDQASV